MIRALRRGSTAVLAAFAAMVLMFTSLGIATHAQAAPETAPRLNLVASISGSPSEITSGENLTYLVQWSCESVAESCKDVTLEATVPGLLGSRQSASLNTELPLNLVSARPSSHDENVKPVHDGDTITWNMGDVIAGATGGVEFTVRPLTPYWPDGETVDANISFSAPNAQQTTLTSDLSTTVRSENQLDIFKEPVASGAISGNQAEYRISAGYRSMFRTNTTPRQYSDPVNPVSGLSPNGLWGVRDVVIEDQLPETATFVSASNGGTYDPETHTVTWKPQPNSLFTRVNDYRVVVNYDSETAVPGGVGTNDVTITGTGISSDEKFSADSNAQVSFAEANARASITKNVSSASVSPGGTVNWRWGLQNTGNTPINLKFEDVLPCRYVSPDVGTTTCDTPFMTDLKIRMSRTFDGEVDVTYYTHQGKTHTVRTNSTREIPLTVDEGDWVTAIKGEAWMPVSGRDGLFNLSGTVDPDFPTDMGTATTAPDGSKYFSNVNTSMGMPSVQNRLNASAEATDTDGNVLDNVKVTLPRDGISHATVRIQEPFPKYGVYKAALRDTGSAYPNPNKVASATLPVFGTNDEVTFRLGFYTAQSGAKFYPVITDLLPEGMEFLGEDTLEFSANWPEETLPQDEIIVETEDVEIDGKTRQLIRFTWPEEYYVDDNVGSYSAAGTREVNFSFKAKVTRNMMQGDYSNDLMIFDAKVPNLRNSSNPDQCVRDWWAYDDSAVDTHNLSGLKTKDGKPDTTRRGCTTSVPFAVTGQPALQGLNWVKGNNDDEFVSYPNAGSVNPSSPATFKMDLVNNGTAPARDVVLYDILPYPGDFSAASRGVGTDQRGSEWRPLMTGPLRLSDEVPETAEVLYSMSSNPCRGELLSLGKDRETGPADCSDKWLTADQVNGRWNQVRAIRVAFGPEAELTRGQTWSMELDTVAPAVSSGTAWNNFAATGKTLNGTPLVVAEPAKVGIHMGVDPEITKRVNNVDDVMKPGSTVEYEIVVSNKGPGYLNELEITDELPEGLTYQDHKVSVGTWDAEKGVWDLQEKVQAEEDGKLVFRFTGDEGDQTERLIYFDEDDETYWVLDADKDLVKVDVAADALEPVMVDRGLAPSENQEIAETLTITATIDEDTQGEEICNRASLTGSLQLNDELMKDHTAKACFTVAVDIGDTVWFDRNADGVFDEDEEGIPGVKLTLKDAEGETVATTTTDEDGKYLFTGLEPGDYTVEVDHKSLPEGTTWHPTFQKDDGTNGIVEQKVGNENVMDLDFGFTAGASIGDFVWYDTNRNGIQDEGEPGIEDVTVTLTDAEGNPVKDIFGETVEPVKTDADGKYLFTDLPEATYIVTFTAPEGFELTETGARPEGVENAEVLDSRGLSSEVTVKVTEANLDIDVGFYRNVDIGDTVWFDSNADGVFDEDEEGIPGVKLTLKDAEGETVATTTTDEDGKYLFTGLEPGDYTVEVDHKSLPEGTTWHPTFQKDDGTNGIVEQEVGNENVMDLDFGFTAGASIGDFVWYDSNRNGIQDEGEPGIEGVTVTLTDAEGNPVKDIFGETVEPVKTDADGKYLFTDLPEATYTVTFTAPEGFELTETGARPEGVENAEVLDSRGLSSEVTVKVTEANLDIDVGFYRTGTIGDTIYFDENADGTQDEDEPGIEGLTVELLDENGEPVLDDNDEPITATTDENGKYLFEDLNPGTYQVRVTGAEDYERATDAPEGSTEFEDGVITGPKVTLDWKGSMENLDQNFGLVVPEPEEEPEPEPTPDESEEPTPGEGDGDDSTPGDGEPTPGDGDDDDSTPGDGEPTPGESEEPTPGETEEPTPGEEDATPEDEEESTDPSASDQDSSEPKPESSETPGEESKQDSLARTGFQLAGVALLGVIALAIGLVLRRKRQA